MSGFEKIEVSDVPLEDARQVLSLLLAHLRLDVECSEGFWGREYRIVERPTSTGEKR